MKLFSWWTQFCMKLNHAFERFYYNVGYHVSKRPFLAIFCGIFISLLFGLGFLKFHEVDRVEKLYIPQDSQASKDLERGSKYYLLKARPEEFILKFKDNKDIIEPAIFKTALDIHNTIINIEGLQDICVKVEQSCFTQSPLSLFNFQKKDMDRVREILRAVIMSSNPKQFGRSWQMLFPNILGGFETDMHAKNFSARSIRVQYFLQYPETDTLYNKAQEWELLYLDEMQKWQEKLSNESIELFYSSGRSANDDVLRSAKKDTKLAAVSLVLMIVFCAVTLANFQNPIDGHFLLGLGGVLTLVIGIGGSFGLVLLCGNPFIAFTGVLPFLVLGIGIDNMFIITNCLDQFRHEGRDRFERIAKTMSHVGASITMTTLTDLVAFGVSTVTDFPAIRYFSLYVAASISYCYLMVLTLFLGMLSLDVKRIEERRLDTLLCIVSVPKNGENIKEQTSIPRKIMRLYGNGLMKLPVKIGVTIFFVALLGISVYGMTKTDQSFDPYAYGLKDSAFTKFSSYRDKAYPKRFEISVICDTPLNYTDRKVQEELVKLDEIARENGYVQNQTINWMSEFSKYAKAKNLTIEGKGFYSNLHEFLKTYSTFGMDLRLNPYNNEIMVSRIIMFGGDEQNSLFLRDEMVTLRTELKSKSKLPVYAVSQSYIYTEQFVVILGDTIRNIAITSTAIFFITFPYLVDLRITLLVFSSFITIIVELLAFMYFWNMSLNSLSMIIIVMAIGFTVDYSAHIAHAFNISKSKTTEERVVDALESMGTSVLMGGISTFVGICVTGFANSGIFRVFFKMVFGMVVLGLLHGLVFLPVLLTMRFSKNWFDTMRIRIATGLLTQVFCRISKTSFDVNNKIDTTNENEKDLEKNSCRLQYVDRPRTSYHEDSNNAKVFTVKNADEFDKETYEMTLSNEQSPPQNDGVENEACRVDENDFTEVKELDKEEAHEDEMIENKTCISDKIERCEDDNSDDKNEEEPRDKEKTELKCCVNEAIELDEDSTSNIEETNNIDSDKPEETNKIDSDKPEETNKIDSDETEKANNINSDEPSNNGNENDIDKEKNVRNNELEILDEPEVVINVIV